MKNLHRKLAVWIAGFVIGGVIAGVANRWKESTTAVKIGFAVAIGGGIGLIVALYFRAMK